MSTSQAVIRFGLRESYKTLSTTPEQESLIILNFSLKGKRFRKSTGFKSSYKNWDIGKQRLKTGKSRGDDAYTINTFLNNVQSFLEQEYIKNVSNGNGVDLRVLSDLTGNYIKGISLVNEQALNEETLTKYASNLLDGKRNSISPTTYRSYNQTISNLRNYEKENQVTLNFEDIDMAFYRKFIQFLENSNYSLNSIGKHIKNLKTFLNDALVNGVSQNIIFKNRSFKAPKEITTEIYLSKQELSILESKDFSYNKDFQLARDIFLIGCYTGQRVSDYNGLTENNIEIIHGHKLIKIKQKKTKAVVHIPITKEIKNVMKRYEGKFPPKLAEPILRKNLKLACRAVKLTEMISLSRNKGGQLLQEQVPKFQLVKTHTARRTFCTNHYLDGKPIQNIMLFSGHRTEKEFYKYIRVQKSQEALAVLKSGFFE